MCALWHDPLTEAKSYTQSGSRSRGFLRWLRGNMLVQPEYFDIPMRRSKHDPSRVLEKIAFIPPMRLAQLMQERRPGLLFCPAEEQTSFMQKSSPRCCCGWGSRCRV